MDQFKNRRWVKIIAIADVALSCFVVTILLLVILKMLFFTSSVQGAATNSGNIEVMEEASTILTVIWFIIIIFCITEAIKVAAALKLLKACKAETDPKEAYKLCKFWRNVNTVFMVLNILNLVTYTKSSLLNIVLYAVCIYFVHGYMRELLAFEGVGNAQPVIIMTDNNVEVNVNARKFDGGESGVPGGYGNPPPSYVDAVNQPPPQWT